VKRSLERNPKLVASLLPGDTATLRYAAHKGILEEAYEVRPDCSRIDNVVMCCARALYFHETKRKFNGRIKMVAPFMSYLDDSIDNDVVVALGHAKTYLLQFPAQGENPEVFYYKFAEGQNTAVMLLCFYGGTEFLVQLDKRQTEI
jgi:hypothetical protein